MRPHSRRRALTLLAAALVGTSLLTAYTATHAENEATEHNAARPRGRPDLVISGGRARVWHRPATLTWFAFGGGTNGVIWRHETTNEGRRGSSPSRTSVAFLRPGGWRNLATLPVPALAPGARHTNSSEFDITFDDRWPYGTYPVRLCADVLNVVAERDEKNNCRRLHPIYVAPTDLEGEVRGVAGVPLLWPGLRMRWHGDVRYNLFPVEARFGNQGGFDYRWASGRVTFSLEGGEGGCTWSGTGTYRPYLREPIALQFGTDAHYRAELAIRPDFHFRATRTCADPRDTIHMDFYPFRHWVMRWLDTGEQTLLDPGTTRLVGTRTSGELGTGGFRHSWNLQLKGADQ